MLWRSSRRGGVGEKEWELAPGQGMSRVQTKIVNCARNAWKKNFIFSLVHIRKMVPRRMFLALFLAIAVGIFAVQMMKSTQIPATEKNNEAEKATTMFSHESNEELGVSMASRNESLTAVEERDENNTTGDQNPTAKEDVGRDEYNTSVVSVYQCLQIKTELEPFNLLMALNQSTYQVADFTTLNIEEIRQCLNFLEVFQQQVSQI